MDLLQLSKTARRAALSAGKIIQSRLNENQYVQIKKGGSSLASHVVTEVDEACEKAILAHILPTCTEYNLALLTEEREDDGSRFKKDYFWCIDPLDGTLPFIEKRAGFSVSIALVAKDGSPKIGVVYDPTNSTLYHAIKDYGAFKNDQKWTVDHQEQSSPSLKLNQDRDEKSYLSFITDKKLKDTPKADEIVAILERICQKHGLKGFKEIAGGGAVMNAIGAIEQAPACFIKMPKNEHGGGSLWDYAATACIYHELGLVATNFAGHKLDLNRVDSTFMNHEGVFFANY